MTLPLRLLLVAIACHATFASWILWELRGEETVLVHLWSVLVAAGAAGTWSLVVHPTRQGFFASILGLVCGHAGRGVVVIADLASPAVGSSTSRGLLTASFYGATATLIAYTWLLVVLPAVEVHRASRA